MLRQKYPGPGIDNKQTGFVRSMQQKEGQTDLVRTRTRPTLPPSDVCVASTLCKAGDGSESPQKQSTASV